MYCCTFAVIYTSKYQVPGKRYENQVRRNECTFCVARFERLCTSPRRRSILYPHYCTLYVHPWYVYRPRLRLRNLSESRGSAVRAHTSRLVLLLCWCTYVDWTGSRRQEVFLGVPTTPPIYCVMYEISERKHHPPSTGKGPPCNNRSIARGPLLFGNGVRHTRS